MSFIFLRLLITSLPSGKHYLFEEKHLVLIVLASVMKKCSTNLRKRLFPNGVPREIILFCFIFIFELIFFHHEFVNEDKGHNPRKAFQDIPNQPQSFVCHLLQYFIYDHLASTFVCLAVFSCQSFLYIRYSTWNFFLYDIISWLYILTFTQCFQC